MSDEDLFEHIWTQLDELGGEDGVISKPEDVSDEQFERVLGEVEEASQGDILQ